MAKHKIGLLVLTLVLPASCANQTGTRTPEPAPQVYLTTPYDDFNNDWWSDREEVAEWDRY